MRKKFKTLKYIIDLQRKNNKKRKNNKEFDCGNDLFDSDDEESMKLFSRYIREEVLDGYAEESLKN